MRRLDPVRRAIAMAAIFAALVVALAPGSATAHTELVSSDPEAASRVDQLPATVELRFSGPVEPSLATVVLSAPNRGVESRLTVRAGASPSVLRADVGDEQRTAAPEGVWTVDYRVTSTDGHPIQGEIRFRVDRPASAGHSRDARANRSSSAAPERPAPPVESAGAAVWWWVGLAVLIGLGVVLAVARRRRSLGPEPGEGTAG